MSQKPIVPEDLYELILVSSPAASPDGSHAVYVAGRPSRDRLETSIWIASEEEYRPLTGGPGDTCPQWRPGGSLVSFVRVSGEGESRRWELRLVPTAGGESWLLARFDHPILSAYWSPQGDRLAVEARIPEGDRGDPWKADAIVVERLPPWFNGAGWVHDRRLAILIVDYPSGRSERVTPKGVDSWGPVWSPDGRFIAYVRAPSDLEPYRHEVVVLDVDSGEETVIARGLTVSGLAWSPDGGMIAIRGHRDERGPATHHRVMVFDLNGELVDCVSCSLDRNTLNTVNSDVRGPSCTPSLQWGVDGRIYFPVSDAGSVHLYAARPRQEPEPVIKVDHAVVDEFSLPGEEEGIVYYTLMRATEPKELYTYSGGEPVRLTGHNDVFLQKRLIAEPRHYRVESRDGTPVDVWILPPAEGGECEQCTPWILYIHGGPKTSFGHGFMFEFHALSGAGYAIVYSNPRGSDGYGEEYADIRGRWGTVDYEDLMAVAESAPSLDPSLDPSRAAVAGGSYGGWMTAYITTKTSQFKAAVAMRGCVNWTSFYGASDIGWYFTPRQLGSHPWQDPSVYLEKSPLFHADKIKTPTLIIHSTHDYRCPIDQGVTHYTMLRVQGVPARLVVFPGETHDLSRSGTPRRRVRRIREIIAWLDKHLKG